MIHHKIIGRIIEQLHHRLGVLQDALPVSPGNDGGEESRDLDVLFFAEIVRNRDRIRPYEIRGAVLNHLMIEKFL